VRIFTRLNEQARFFTPKKRCGVFAGAGISGVVGEQLGGASPEKKSGGWPV
jgi:hypothetical protein